MRLTLSFCDRCGKAAEIRRELLVTDLTGVVKPGWCGLYSLCDPCFAEVRGELRELFAGWAKLDAEHPANAGKAAEGAPLVENLERYGLEA